MRVFAVGAAAACLMLASPVLAQSPAPAGGATMKDCAAQWQTMKKAGTAKGSYHDFSKSCLAAKPGTTATETRTQPQTRMQQVGPTPSAPAAGKAAPKGSNADATGAVAKCKDGTYSHAKGHTGACSHHGGVGQWLK
jgi:hypothetical protein